MRDYQGNLTLTDRDYYLNNAVYSAVEYPASPPIRGISYLRGSSIPVTVRIVNHGPYDLVGWITFDDARLASPGPNTYDSFTGTWSNPPEYRTLAIAPFMEYLELPAGSQVDLQIELSGTPNFVALGDIQVKYDMPLWRESDSFLGNNGTLGTFDSWERLFLVDATPIAPQAVPWADYLEYTCRWAFGHTGDPNVKTWMTRGMHYSLRSATSRARYLPSGVWFYPIFFDGNIAVEAPYNLGLLTALLDSQFWTELDCRDFAGGLQIALSQHGHSSTPHLLTGSFDGQIHGFTTNLLCPAGTDSTIPSNYSAYGFNFHVVTNEWTGQYIDASTSYRYDPYGVTYNNPATEWALPEYWQNDIGTRYSGLVAGTFYQGNWEDLVPLYEPIVVFPVEGLIFTLP